jgi:hypothetical protein
VPAMAGRRLRLRAHACGRGRSNNAAKLPTRGFGVAAKLNPAREQLHPYLPDPLDARLGRRDVVEGLASRVDQLHPFPVDVCQSDTDSPAVALHGIRHNTRTSAARSTLGQKSSEDSSAGMRSKTAMRRRPCGVARSREIEGERLRRSEPYSGPGWT